MNRDKMIQEIEQASSPWDIIIIGGGATGLGSAVDAASRGFRTLLVEQEDFAKGTSSRSTKLIHGGLRYLQQGNVTLVVEALRERGLLCQNAPHLVHHLPFLVPNYHWWEGPFYGVGLKIYDMLAGKLGIEPSKHLNRRQTLNAIPTLEKEGLRGGVVYYDGQFDDSRLAVALARTAVDHGATVVNYLRASSLIKKRGICIGIKARDAETGKHYSIYGRVIINATGIFSDAILKKDNPHAKNIISPSQGVHLVLDQSFQPSKTAILVPHTSDNRVLFMVPWHNRVLVGTTDTLVKKTVLEPRPQEKEIEFLLEHAGKYLSKKPKRSDVLSVFAGLRPLVKASGKENTAALSRDHAILISKSGLVTIAGGKWTTFRKMAEDVINKAILVGGLPDRPCITKNLPLHAKKEGLDPKDPWSTYGADGKILKEMMQKEKKLATLLHPNLPYKAVEVIFATRYEMARTLDDILARRNRSLLLNARTSIEIAPKVAKLMAEELHYSESWEKKQVKAFREIAKQYCL